MLLLAHVGISIVIAKFLGVNVPFALLAGLLPDIIDKPFNILKIFPTGRFLAHTLLFAFFSSLLILIFTKPLLAVYWFLLISSHYLLDLKGFIPLFYPLDKHIERSNFHIKVGKVEIVGELIGFLMILWFFYY